MAQVLRVRPARRLPQTRQATPPATRQPTSHSYLPVYAVLTSHARASDLIVCGEEPAGPSQGAGCRGLRGAVVCGPRPQPRLPPFPQNPSAAAAAIDGMDRGTNTANPDRPHQIGVEHGSQGFSPRRRLGRREPGATLTDRRVVVQSSYLGEASSSGGLLVSPTDVAVRC